MKIEYHQAKDTDTLDVIYLHSNSSWGYNRNIG